MAIRNESTYFQWQPLVLQRQILFRRLVLHQQQHQHQSTRATPATVARLTPAATVCIAIVHQRIHKEKY